jgi:phosphoglycolate phosphatase
MALKCVYTDLDGTLLGPGPKLSPNAAAALQLCHDNGVEVVLVSGRRRAQLVHDARAYGASAYAGELGSVLTIDGQVSYLTGRDWTPQDGMSVHAQISKSGAPQRLLDRFHGWLEPHTPWDTGREVSHLFRGLVDLSDANAAVVERGLAVRDNGPIERVPDSKLTPSEFHAYHLLPREVSKARAVGAHCAVRGYGRDSCIAIGDSPEDRTMAGVVGHLYLVANTRATDGLLPPNVSFTSHPMGDGFHEAIVAELT